MADDRVWFGKATKWSRKWMIIGLDTRLRFRKYCRGWPQRKAISVKNHVFSILSFYSLHSHSRGLEHGEYPVRGEMMEKQSSIVQSPFNWIACRMEMYRAIHIFDPRNTFPACGDLCSSSTTHSKGPFPIECPLKGVPLAGLSLTKRDGLPRWSIGQTNGHSSLVELYPLVPRPLHRLMLLCDRQCWQGIMGSRASFYKKGLSIYFWEPWKYVIIVSSIEFDG